MGRTAIPINLVVMQDIIDVEEKNYRGAATDFYNHCATLYNTKINPKKTVQGSTIYNRIKNNILKTNFKSATRTRVLSPEHLAKLHEGRQGKGGRKNRANTDPRHEQYLMKEMHDRPKLAHRILQGSMSAAIKGKCLDCCCGDAQEIKHCTSYGCPLYNFRPYKPKP